MARSYRRLHVLPHEDPAEFEQLAAAVRDEFQPEGDSENFLVDLMVQARCKLVRLERLQGLAFEQVLTEPGSAAFPHRRTSSIPCPFGTRSR